jgi:hypothetical protein
MSDLSYKYYLNGVPIPPPKEWQDVTIIANFDNNVQPQISITEMSFINEATIEIDNWINSVGILEGMPLEIVVEDTSNSYVIYLYLDFREGFTIVHDTEYKCRVKQIDELDFLDEKVKAVSFGYLDSLGRFDKSDYTDVNVVVRKKFDTTETLYASFILAYLSKELYEQRKEIAKETTETVKLIISAPTQKPAELYYKIAVGLLNIAYRAAMLVTMYKLLKTVFQNLAPVPTKYKGITLRKGLEKICEHFGYTLDCNIREIDSIVYLPSKTNDKIRRNRKLSGIPNANDYGYNFSEFMELVLTLFYAKPKLVDKTLVIRAEKDQYWQGQSGYVMHDRLQETYSYNLDKLVANRIISFTYDYSDEYTIPAEKEDNRGDYSLGTNYEVITNIEAMYNERLKLLRGLEDIRIPVSLGHRRGKLSVFESVLIGAVAVFDSVIKIFGGKPIGESIQENRGALVISSPTFSVPKLIFWHNGQIPEDHRNYLSARAMWQNYHFWKSFRDNKLSQRKIYKDQIIHFGFSDFLKTINNAYFTTYDGKQAKFTSLEWDIDSDRAKADFEVEYEYITRITETHIES